MILENIIELSSEKNLYKDCWLTKLPKDYCAPTEAEIKWLWQFVEKQNYYQNLSEIEKQNLQKITKTIEGSVPMITSDGSVLNTYHRLLLSYSIGKLFIYNQIVSLNVISSIVIYPTFKLRKKYNEARLAACKGVNMLLKPIFSIYEIIDFLNKNYNTSEASMRLLFNKYDEKFIKKNHNDWIEDLKYIETIINKKQTHFQDKIEQKLKEIEQKIATFTTQVLSNLLKDDIILKQLVELAHLAYKKTENQLQILNNFLPMLKDTNRSDLNFFWIERKGCGYLCCKT